MASKVRKNYIMKIKFKKMLSQELRNEMWNTNKVLEFANEKNHKMSMVGCWDNKADMLAFLVHFGLMKESKLLDNLAKKARLGVKNGR